MRKILHIDMDAFFASVEQRDFPELRGKPVIVGGKPASRGVVAACSYEARKFGVHSAMPCSRAVKLCKDAIFVPPRFDVYREASEGIHAVFRKYTTMIEPLSLDEAYLDVTEQANKLGSATEVAQRIKSDIKKAVKLTASAGVSYNKFLAKIATEFGQSGGYYYRVARGLDERPVRAHRQRKSLGQETTFDGNVTDKKVIWQTLQRIAERLEAMLESKQLAARTVTLKVRYANFKLITRSQTQTTYFISEQDIISILPALLKKTDVGDRAIRLIGITMSNFEKFSEVDSSESAHHLHDDPQLGLF